MFLRFGHVVGLAGVIGALIIVGLSKLITFFTAPSLSAIATNTRVKGGRAYFLISRSLGLEFGGAIGIVFFLGQTVAVAMYAIGFAEAFTDAFPTAVPSEMVLFGITFSGAQIISTIVNTVVFISVMIGASWTVNLQFFYSCNLMLVTCFILW